MKKILLVFAMLALSVAAFAQSSASVRVVTFRFVAGDDMFYIPWEDNIVELDRLYSIVDEYRSQITSGEIPIRVDGYSASMRDEAKNHVKSELITHKGLTEDNFITNNYTTAYTAPDGTTYKDMVVVTLHIPAKTEPVVEKQTEPVAVAEPADRRKRPYFAVRTNLLYDVLLLPTLGVEWRMNNNIGVKLDVSFSHWGKETGKVQKMWFLNPEVRWYIGASKKFYVGASGNFGKYNTYGYLFGGLYPETTGYGGYTGYTGYQGRLWNAGVTGGYQLFLLRRFSLDFNLGLGYTSLKYDSFNMIDRVRIYNKKNQSKGFWGPTQAGVSLVWKIGANK